MTDEAAYFRIKGRPERYETRAQAAAAANTIAAKGKTKLLEVQCYTQWHRRVTLPAAAGFFPPNQQSQARSGTSP